MVNDLAKRVDDGRYRPVDRLTLGEYLVDRWLPTQQARLRPSTFDAYRRDTEAHVVPALGAITIRKLTPEDLDRFYVHLATTSRRNGSGGGLSPKTVRKIHAILHKALHDACRKGTVLRNVAELADPPKLRASKRQEIRAWNEDELTRFLELADGHHDKPAWFLTAYTGLRRGEVLGLRWRDVDFDASSLSVRQAAIIVAYKLIISDIKTDNGRRTLDLDGDTLKVLGRWRKEQARLRQLAGASVRDDDLVFGRADGTIPNPDVFSQSFDRFVARSGLPRIRYHDLRHTHATILLKAGVPVKVVSERLGHASPAFTMTVYQHVLPGIQADAATTFATLLASRRNPSGES